MEIVASSITNLTDARYFAAMGVNWLCLDLRPDSDGTLLAAQAIVDWVEGPAICADLRNQTEDQIAEVAAALKPVAMIVDGFTNVPGPFNGRIVRPLLADMDVAAINADILFITSGHAPLGSGIIESLIRAASDKTEVWVDINALPNPLTMIDELDHVDAIVVHGGSELATGVKSYEELDEIIEALHEIAGKSDH